MKKNKALRAKSTEYRAEFLHSLHPCGKTAGYSATENKYPGQKMFIVAIENYAYLVPFIETEDGMFLKTIIPSGKATKLYLKR